MIGRRHNDTVKEKYDVENEGGGRVFGPLSQRWHQRIHIHTQGIPCHTDHTAADTETIVGNATSIIVTIQVVWHTYRSTLVSYAIV